MARGRRRRGGGGSLLGNGLVQTFISAAIVCGVMLGAWNALPSAEGSLMEQAEVKSDALRDWYENGWPPDFSFPDFGGGGSGSGGDNGSGGGSNGDLAMPQADAEKALDKLKVKEPQRVPYNRDEWKHWTTSAGQGSSCWNVRDQVLFDEAVKGSVTLVDKNNKKVSSVRDACKITKGKWNGLYTGKTFTDPSDLDIDHMIPLSYAAKQGGQAWDAKKKEKYANALKPAHHLVAVEAGANRQKGDQGPSTWKPKDKSSHCSYATSWVAVSAEWKLTIPSADKKALKEMLKTC